MAKNSVVTSLAAIMASIGLSSCAVNPELNADKNKVDTTDVGKPFIAQVVGLQWLNPLQRQDYSTEWQLLWAMGKVRPNKRDDMLELYPEKFSELKYVSDIASSNKLTGTFKGYHRKYVIQMIARFHGMYFSNPTYFYNAHDFKHKKGWNELAGIHVEYAVPAERLDPIQAGDVLREEIIDTFSIGNPSFPNSWTKSTPPDVRVTAGGAQAGFISLAAALDYLQAHPKETVWVMSWDAPSFPKDEQINENMVLLVLAGPHYKTERDALAWIGYPVTQQVSAFTAQKGLPPPTVQAWQATLAQAAANGRKTDAEIGYVIHDANNAHPVSSDRIGYLAQTLTTELPAFDFLQQTFNTPALLGEMGAATALTNVALGIAQANHFGQNVLVAGTSDAGQTTGVLILPPAKVRPIDPVKPWFRARGGGNAYLMWWGIRHAWATLDAGQFNEQGYSK
ncbi:virulence factor [Janthinobacterium sp. SUN073]|uniref:virulence factor n=1 Tax=Janthinobacterium sp. SUN073 TaxID=3004102 RepID=UPI0025AEF81F|nr:virulence factor [Janthinobacterium sp. SUN073]MDN2697471.1 virulence factor [Janthinobacterium sp. SUN073]